MCAGVGKSGWPMPRLMIDRPCASSALARASTSKAVSVPRSDIRFARASMGGLVADEGERLFITDARHGAKRLARRHGGGPFPHTRKHPNIRLAAASSSVGCASLGTDLIQTRQQLFAPGNRPVTGANVLFTLDQGFLKLLRHRCVGQGRWCAFCDDTPGALP